MAVIVWLWDADSPGHRLLGVRGTKEEAMAVCEKLLKTGNALSAAVELAHLRVGGKILNSYYEYTGYGWTATRDARIGKVTWVSFDEVQPGIETRARGCDAR